MAHSDPGGGCKHQSMATSPGGTRPAGRCRPRSAWHRTHVLWTTRRTFCGQPAARPWTTRRPRWTTRPDTWTTRRGLWTNGTGARTRGQGAWIRTNPTCCDANHRRTTTSCGFGLDRHPAAAYSSKVAPAPDGTRNPPESGPAPRTEDRTGHRTEDRTDHRRRNDPTDDPAATRHPILVTADRQPDGAPSPQNAYRTAPGTQRCPRGSPHPRRRQQAWSRRVGNGGERTTWRSLER